MWRAADSTVWAVVATAALVSPARIHELLHQLGTGHTASGAFVSAARQAGAAELIDGTLMFTGGSQFALVGVLAGGGVAAGGSAIATAALLGIRNVVYGMRMKPLVTS